mmetsp:Transcript_16973/g.26393  ORF Transcript_16973/g.26393 Transcript_16973/m.26393 type:complete len:616 (+) Transcript_16973:58-1905(+)
MDSRPRKINLILHHRDEEIQLVIYRGTSEQAIYDNIREITNLYHFRIVDKKEQPLILTCELPNKTHVYVRDPTERKEESDEPTPEQQLEYLQPKMQQIIDAKNTLDVFKKMLLSLEQSAAEAAAAQAAANADATQAQDAAATDENDDVKKDTEETVPSSTDASIAATTAASDEANATTTTAESAATAATTDTAAASADGGGDEAESKSAAVEESKTETVSAENAAATADDAVIVVTDAAAAEASNEIQYAGQYKALVDEMESKLDTLQSIILEHFELSADLLPPPKSEANIADEQQQQEAAADVTLSEEEKAEQLTQRVIAKLQPNQEQIAQMQQLLQMQQTSLMAMLAVGGSMGAAGIAMGGGGGGNMPRLSVNAAAVGGTPLFGAGLSNRISLSPQNAPQTTDAADAKQEEEAKPVVVDRSAEYTKWFSGSKVIEDDEYDTLLSFFEEKGKDVQSMERIFVASADGFAASDFHEKCDDIGPTLLVAMSEHNRIFGGFTKESWRDTSRKGGIWREDASAFIFMLRSPSDEVLPERWKVLPDKKDKSIRCDRRYGPTFGYGYDVRLCNECDKKKESSSQVDNEDACYGVPAKPEDFLTGEFYFLVKEFEVYKVNF